MKKLSSLEYLRLNRFKKFLYNLACFFCAIPGAVTGFLKMVGRSIKKFGVAVANDLKDIVMTFAKGSWITKVSFIIMGFGNLARGQIFRGLFFLAFEVVFIVYMYFGGAYWLMKYKTLGTVPPRKEYDEILDVEEFVPGDPSFKILLYGTLTIIFILALIYTWRLNVKQNKLIDEILASGKKLKSNKDDLRSVVDDQFHKTLLALPLTGITLFTIFPTIVMILVAFTNYDALHDGYTRNLFTWVGLENFNAIIGTSGIGSLGYTFGEILSWTLIWAFLATFTNYFLGMIVAIMINKKGIRFKKVWRGIFVLTIAIPQFISLLYVSRLFNQNGIVNTLLLNLGWIKERIDWWQNAKYSRVLVVLINIWIGIPYLMLIATGILMNIPQDLYESAKIDGASIVQQYRKITLPYMFFVTGPYLITSFIGNINNFNVIYLLTNGQARTNNDLLVSMGENVTTATDVDLLITWLFNLTMGTSSAYNIAGVIGIMIFIVVAVLSLIAFNVMPSTKNEEDYS